MLPYLPKFNNLTQWGEAMGNEKKEKEALLEKGQKLLDRIEENRIK